MNSRVSLEQQFDEHCKCLLPLVSASEDKRIKVIGTGVLIRLGETRLLISAAHVFDEATERKLHYPDANGELTELPANRIAKSNSTDITRLDDSIDMGALDLGSAGVDSKMERKSDLLAR